MTFKEAQQVYAAMAAAGLDCSFARWGDDDYSVGGTDTATGITIRIDNMEQWQARQPQGDALDGAGSDAQDDGSHATWQILRYHFSSESEVDEFYADWWQVLRSGSRELAGVDLATAKAHVTAHAASTDIVQYAGGTWTAAAWRKA